jgi:ribonuclease HI
VVTISRGQITASDESEGNGSMGSGFIVQGNSAATGSIRVGRTEESTDSTRAEMAALLEVLIGVNVTENLVVMVDNQSILREISRWVGEGGRTFLALSANPDIFRMVIRRLCMRIEQGTATILRKIKSHRSEPLNETANDLADLGRTIDQEHAVWTIRSNRMVFSWVDGQKSTHTSTWNQGVKNGVRLGAGRYRFEARLQQGVRNWQGLGALPNGVDRVISSCLACDFSVHTMVFIIGFSQTVTMPNSRNFLRRCSLKSVSLSHILRYSPFS